MQTFSDSEDTKEAKDSEPEETSGGQEEHKGLLLDLVDFFGGQALMASQWLLSENHQSAIFRVQYLSKNTGSLPNIYISLLFIC